MQTSLCPFCMSEVQGEVCPSCGRTAAYSADPTHLPAGYILEDKRSYILGAALGQGGFGVTYIAWDGKRKQKVAIKEYFPTYCSSRTGRTTVSAYRGQEETYLKGRARFLDEARMLKSLSDLKSVVNVLDFFEANNSAYLVMEYLDGLSLKDYVQKNGKLPAQQFLNQLKPLMADMEKMHRRGVVHRDIAPDNIILLPDGRLKLIDFGAARSYVGDKSMTVVVKKGFAPVEQYMRKGSNASTDVYALAATIYYCITGIVPPDSAERQYGEALLQSPIMLGVDLLPHQENALEQALEIQPKDRTQSIADFLKALFNAPRAVQPAAVAAPEEKTENRIKPKQAKTEKPKTARPAEKKKASVKIWIIAAVLAVCVCIGIAVAGMDWPVAMETVEHPAMEQTEAVGTQPEESLNPQAVKYNEAVDLFYGEEYGRAAIAFAKLGDYRDAKEISHKIWDAIADRDTIVAKGGSTIAVRGYGTVAACGRTAPDVTVWTDIIAVSQYWGSPLTAGLRSDGTVVVADTKDGKKDGDIPGWSDIVAIETDGFTVFGLKDDGTILTYQDAPYPPEIMSSYEADAYLKKIETLTDVVKLDSQSYFDQQSMLILIADGTVIFNFEVSRNQDIVESCATTIGIVQQKNDGTMLYPQSGYAEEQKIDVSQWRDIVSISSAYDHILGLKKDGTVVGSGDNTFKLLDVQDWTDIVAVSTSNFHSVGLKSNGTVVTCGSTRNDERRKAENWTDIKLPADRETLLSEIRISYITDSAGEEAITTVNNNDNILMGMGVSDLELRRIGTRTEAKRIIPDYPLFNLPVKRREVRSITFLDTMAGAPAAAVDASAKGDGKVKAWAVKNGTLYDVFVASDGKILAPKNCRWLLGFMSNLEEIHFNNALDTSRTTDMCYLFDSCEKLTTLDFCCFDTTGVTNLAGMFIECTRLEEVNLTSFETGAVTNMSGMFSMCKNLRKVDLTGFDTSNVTKMESMFLQCNSLEKLDLSSFDVSNVTDAYNMFFKCPAEHPDWYDHTMN